MRSNCAEGSLANYKSKRLTHGRTSAPEDAQAKGEELATQSVSTEEPADEAKSGSDESADADLPEVQMEEDVATEEDVAISQDTMESCAPQAEERDGQREAGVESRGLSYVTDDGDSGSRNCRRTAPSQTGDGQAKRRALKRYREDESGRWVKGRAGDGGQWIPEPGATIFPTVEAALEHERNKTLLRRCSWANLRGDMSITRRAVTAEGVQTRLHQTKEAEETRRSVDEARDALTAKFEEGVKTLCAQRPDRIRDPRG